MRVEKIPAVSNTQAKKEVVPKKDEQTVNRAPEAYDKGVVKDEYIPSEKTEENGTYDDKGVKVDLDALNKAIEAADRAHSKLKALVKEMLEKQGLSFREAFELEDIEEIEVDEVTQEKAAEMIAEGGEYSVEAVSDRIVDFAKAISGGDTSKLEILKDAISQGFAEAKKALGGTLPDISEQTYERVMEKLDEWANEVE